MGEMSRCYRKKLRVWVPSKALELLVRETQQNFMTATILRNGPRILRACTTIAKEIEAQHAKPD